MSDIALTIRTLNGLTAALTNQDQLKNELIEAGTAQTLQRFYEEKSPSGKAWERLSLATIAAKGGDRRKLRHTLSLIKSIKGEKTQSGVFIFADDNDQEKVKSLQFGTKNMPARSFFGVSDKDKKQFEAITIAYIESQL